MRLGLKAAFERVIGWSGQNLAGVNGMAVGRDGTLYAIHSAGLYAHRQTWLILETTMTPVLKLNARGDRAAFCYGRHVHHTPIGRHIQADQRVRPSADHAARAEPADRHHLRLPEDGHVHVEGQALGEIPDEGILTEPPWPA